MSPVLIMGYATTVMTLNNTMIPEKNVYTENQVGFLHTFLGILQQPHQSGDGSPTREKRELLSSA